jgi:Uri superfamily endonuclease
VAGDVGAPRTYQLAIDVGRPICIKVGRLGEFRFPAGRYIYTGSARRGLDARVRRHRSQTKRLHWHIDYLLAASGTKITGVTLSHLPECTISRATRGSIVANGFGASDCRAGCGSHLKLVTRMAGDSSAAAPDAPA